MRPTRNLALLLTSLLAVSACTGSSNPGPGAGPQPAGVELAELAIEDPLKVGVVVTLESDAGLGEALLPSAAGAQVAAERLALGGTDITLEVVDDKGTTSGARDAIESLLSRGVSGIVVATAGDHVVPALQVADDAETAILAPYLRDPGALPDDVWLTGPDTAAVTAALQGALDEAGVKKPFVVTGNGVLAAIDAAGTAEVADSDPNTVAARVAREHRRGVVDGVVVAASARTQGQLVAALQGRSQDLPVFLTPEALSLDFADELVAAGGTPADELVTVGVDATDVTTLGQGDRAESVAAYFSALRLLVGDPRATDLFDSVPFAEVAGGADTASHDAVVALAAAAAAGGTTEAGPVRDALDGLEVDLTDGLAGPVLDFGSAVALPAEAVVPLHSTTQDPGVRPVAGSQPRLRWFAATAEEG